MHPLTQETLTHLLLQNSNGLLSTVRVMALKLIAMASKRSPLSFSRERVGAVFALLLLISCAQAQSQTPNSSPLPRNSVVFAVAKETADQPQLMLSEKTATAVFVERSAEKATVVNQPGGGSLISRLLLFPVRIVKAIAGAFGEGSKSGTNSPRDGVGEVVDSKILDDIAVPNLPPDTPGVPVLSDSAATNESGLKSAI
ncbi:MAG TPA: hypothetical protein VGO56_19605, partial [Pyrinomonadaceae bacterium]|nr:hypothetical protein [Pyrinomonadaceae bacterium]